MTPRAKQVFWDIINCGLCEYKHPCSCSGVIGSQNTTEDDFHIPEPWNGDLGTARILFVSINPGYSLGELYPRKGNPYWTVSDGFNQNKVQDYFERRFDRSLPYVKYKNGGHAFSIKMEDDEYKKVSGFWTYVFKMANSLIPNADPLRDFAITEIVHCKSKDISFLDDSCFEKCMDNHLAKVFEQAPKVEWVIFIGGSVRTHICKRYGFPSPIKQKWYRTTKLNGNDVKITFVDHNNAFADKNGNRAYGIKPIPESIERI